MAKKVGPERHSPERSKFSDNIPDVDWDNKKIKNRWDLLKPEDIEYMDGDKDLLLEALMQLYGYDEIYAVNELINWLPQLAKGKK